VLDVLDVLDVPVDDVDDEPLDEVVSHEVPLDDEFDDSLPESESRSESPESPPQRREPPVVSEPNRKTRCSPVVLVELLELLESVVPEELPFWIEELPSFALLPLPLEFEAQPESPNPPL
jgi:hypothetical protein